ncbi:ribosomal RNA small subunit methyltransferase B [Gottschalkia acidurici 9a]|uniref:16S rRNA (cytosine(967)-C(5))-methyltransferase n=1 Tax=Gottschalkia acidurici (strain ATCC 7906 / DSM 604 / BCRC 14475 / CIP 104303 / KCTC 5404 / NCIMB 10678 / 9a) TaxID=1128398 RepID=K0AY16_GOTA9|nr:16S rRNA (cytosine(967)-C(5))-methyltransferase RsmB [Gottschalkia acidurici]AFS78688.1 ribosomal RNA small subunit methyltransferase B [Gottschalkia acidurici 9a]
MANNSREIALKILNEVNEENAYSNISINRNMPKGINDLDSSLIRELVYGVLENKIYIDYVIKNFSTVRLKKIAPVVMNILRLGIYQLIFMDRIPDSAAVNESVKLSKKYSHRGSQGFVNGLLRNISRNKDNIKLPNKNKEKVKYLSVKYSHPEWMIERWIKEYGFEFTESLCIANNSTPKLNIRVNTLKIDRDTLVNILNQKNIDCKKTRYSTDGIIVENPINITELDEFKKGLFQIQDESSMLVSQIMDPKEGSLVIDICSAPGGKTTHIAQKMNNKGKIIARDIYEHKIKLVKENSERLGINIIQYEQFNALDLDESLIGKADYCLVDAPCSGLGLIRRKPDIKWNKESSDIEGISELQYNILQSASKYVKSNGVLVYSTCTIEKDENINLINKFLRDNENFELANFNDLIDNSEEIIKETGYLELYPNISGTDGFFIAKLLKK